MTLETIYEIIRAVCETAMLTEDTEATLFRNVRSNEESRNASFAPIIKQNEIPDTLCYFHFHRGDARL